MSIFDVKVSEKDAVDFVLSNLRDKNLSEYFNDEKLTTFLSLISESKDIAAAEEFQKQTGAAVGTCHFVATLAKSFIGK